MHSDSLEERADDIERKPSLFNFESTRIVGLPVIAWQQTFKAIYNVLLFVLLFTDTGSQQAMTLVSTRAILRRLCSAKCGALRALSRSSCSNALPRCIEHTAAQSDVLLQCGNKAVAWG